MSILAAGAIGHGFLDGSNAARIIARQELLLRFLQVCGDCAVSYGKQREYENRDTPSVPGILPRWFGTTQINGAL